ncbi:phage Gp37/Gp68 family protein [Cupriavidus sp. 30B13]|uniref:phage Gp37/Gp68 family protein n=1 Tax=Cupriavidus sp. 30B13 TaxID=3384241 RepID=UPI003B90373A
MSENSKIEWTDHTFNPWIGCTKVSPGCDHCYAEAQMDTRLGRVTWGPKGERMRTSPANWRKPLAWNARHKEFFAEHGRRQRVFCASLADVFDNAVDPTWRADLLQLVADTPNLDWLLLTKRIGNAHAMLDDALSELSHGLTKWADAPWPNVWLGATVVNQAEADRDIPKLLATPARVRFLSMEPLLGPVDLAKWIGYCERTDKHGISRNDAGEHILCERYCGVSWVIVGGESGPGARPMHPDWARSLRDQCAAAGVPFLFKQWGEYLPWADFNDARIDDPPEQTRFPTVEWQRDHWEDAGYPMWCDSTDGQIDDMQCMGRVGKKAAGRLLDGVQHDGFPRS